jgi:hypothetical protein
MKEEEARLKAKRAEQSSESSSCKSSDLAESDSDNRDDYNRMKTKMRKANKEEEMVDLALYDETKR